MLLSLTCSIVLVFAARLLWIMHKINYGDARLQRVKDNLRTAICIGSGGHTSEMLRIVDKLSTQKYCPRLYIMADSDTNSESKVRTLEHKRKTVGVEFSIQKIPRSRRVMQDFVSSVWTTLNSIIYTIPVVVNFKPDIVVCNGPGTCIPVCAVAFLTRLLFISNCQIVFVESICRVKTLSLTGKILKYFADVFVVQWEPLLKICSRAKYFGRLT